MEPEAAADLNRLGRRLRGAIHRMVVVADCRRRRPRTARGAIVATIAIPVALLAAACSGSGQTASALDAASGATTSVAEPAVLPSAEIDLEAPEGTDAATMDRAATALEARLASLSTAGYVDVDGTMIHVAITDSVGTTGLEVIKDQLTREGRLTFRPVIDLDPEASPAFSDGTLQSTDGAQDSTGPAPANLDPDTGLTIVDEPFTDSYLTDRDGSLYYHLGPAFFEADAGANAVPEAGGVNGDLWTVRLSFSDTDGELFRAATAELAMEPVGSVTRSLAIVVDGVVCSAPVIASDVGPEGIDGESVVITLGRGDDEEIQARGLAERINTALPVALKLRRVSQRGPNED
jgi:hypothetical protein